ncbi:MAG: type II toxin-antitoxin system VapC family toxin [Planctomycetota bacterium]
MKPSLYLETTIPSYLTSRPSRDLVVAGRQQITRDWWTRRRSRFKLFVSQVVLDEATEGDADAARDRLALIKTMPLLAVTDEVISLTETILRAKVLPKKAARDAAHIATAAVHGMNFLLTWNCVHLANAEIFEDVETVCRFEGHRCPVICTPEELLGA